MTSVPSILIGVPPIVAQTFFSASTSCTVMCNWPMDTPASFGDAVCAHDEASGSEPTQDSGSISAFSCIAPFYLKPEFP